MSSFITENKIRCYNPADGAELDTLRITTIDQFDNILNAARGAADRYNYSALSERKTIIDKFRKSIVDRRDELIEIICKETGKKRFEAEMEILVSTDLMKTQAGHLKKYLSPHKRRSGIYMHKRGRVEYRPQGVAGIISPWNYPLILTLSPVTEALLAGNTVVLKPSEQTPLTSILLKEIFDDLDIDKNIFQVVIGAGEIGKALVKNEKTDIICFTGSTAVGKMIGKACGELLKPCILELGGKDAMIVLEDAHLPRAAKACTWGGFGNAGQTCISVERVYIHEIIYDEFIDLLKKELAKVSCGPNNRCAIGSMTMKSGVEKIENQLLEEGLLKYKAELENPNGKGHFIAPQIVLNSAEDSLLYKEETFGPVITVKKVSSIEDAIKKANDSKYGLSASVFTGDKKKGRFIAGKLNAGMIMINDVQTGYAMGNLPFGGIKESGIGRVHGSEGLKSFSRVVSVVENRVTLNNEPWWYDWSPWFGKIMKIFIKIWYG